MVTKETLKRTAWGCLYQVNDRLDHIFRPQPVDEIISSAKEMIGYEKTHEVIFNNGEKFAIDLRYDWRRCELARPPLG